MSANVSTLSPDARRLLETTRELIRAPEHWTQHTYARVRPGGRDVQPTNPKATCWCIAGAKIKAAADLGISRNYGVDYESKLALLRACDRLFSDNDVIDYVDVNDILGHAAVLRLLAVALGEDDPGAAA